MSAGRSQSPGGPLPGSSPRLGIAGLLLNAPKPDCLRFMPALNTTPEEVEEGLELLRQIFSALEDEA